jgi:hypothetical protein
MYFSDGLLAQIFSREVFALLLKEELVSQALVEKIMGWRHSGFSVHSRIFFMIFSLPRRRGLGDLRLLWRRERLCRHIPPRSQAVLDIFLSHHLQSHTMIERVYGDKDAHLANAAEKEFLLL